MAWKRYNGSELSDDIVFEVERTILSEKANGHRITICIGTDSQVKGDIIEFATVIVFLRERSGGFMFIKKERSYQKMSLKERMIDEVGKSVGIAYDLVDIIKGNGVTMEVHADINSDPTYRSHVALKDAMGYILGMGFIFRAKPNAFASSHCADKLI